MEKIRYAVVGLHHGLEHVNVIPRNSQRQLVAVCDQDRARLEGALKTIKENLNLKYPVKDFLSYEQLLDWNEFDAVVIAVPPHLHAQLAVKAIEAGKHVLLEKPLTCDFAQASQIRQALQKASNLVFQVGYEVRSSQLVSKTLQLIQQGEIGQVVFVWWHMFLKNEGKQLPYWQKERRYGGGKLFDCLCHYMDILSLFAGAVFDRVSAFGTEVGQTGLNPDRIPRVATVIFEYASGAKGNVSLSEVTPSPENSLFGVVGTDGIIYGNPWRPEGAGSLDAYTRGCLYREQISISGSLASRGHLGFAEQHDAFQQAILKGEPVPCSFEDAFEVLLMTRAVDRSLATGTTVSRQEMLEEALGR
ncbi:MAG TPA: Gfo/Idh/MocA family oxidoreductase [bacterium]|nr:Gfo/Idh/MocA family oxidoreductase [bacterium]HPP11253.1 Gfo/Idh/MocA family oxidoreductase [bacterium]